ncbi:MAG: hypothetical protein ABI596_01305 [Pyrinomonadaceae bacterium]
MDLAYCFSPLVEETEAGTVVLDIDGCELLFGSAYELANDIARQAVRPIEMGGLGCRVNVAIAANPDAAIFAARSLTGITFISPGEELTCLGDFPIEALGTELSTKFQGSNLKPKPRRQESKGKKFTAPQQIAGSEQGTANEKKRFKELQEILETLRLWGVRTFRDFASLPVNGVSERLGQEGIRLQQLAAGKSVRHLNLIQPAPDFANAIELEHPIAELEPLSFILARLLNQLCAKLNAYALATNELHVSMKLEDGTSHDRKLTLPSPMRDHKVFLKLLLLNTETHPPQSRVVAISIACEPVKPSVLQNGLFIPLAPEPEKLELTLARLGKLVGENNIGSPELIDTHRPGTFRIKRFTLKGTSHRRGRRRDGTQNQQSLIHGGGGQNVKPQCFLGFRVFRPPLHAIVAAARGYPTKISVPDKTRGVQGKIVELAGPWRTSGDWWRVDGWARDEWDVSVESRSEQSPAGGHRGSTLQVLYRIYRELSSGLWFVEGIYD